MIRTVTARLVKRTLHRLGLSIHWAGGGVRTSSSCTTWLPPKSAWSPEHRALPKGALQIVPLNGLVARNLGGAADGQGRSAHRGAHQAESHRFTGVATVG
jgi:hypothetical protein